MEGGEVIPDEHKSTTEGERLDKRRLEVVRLEYRRIERGQTG